MQHDGGKRGQGRQLDGDRAADPRARTPGKQTLVEAELGADRGEAPSEPGKRSVTQGLPLDGPRMAPEEAAAVAIANRAGGRSVDPSIAVAVGAQTGIDCGDVRVHTNPEVQKATRAMNARAFAYGSDIFLGPGESETDVALIAHELAHVAQQRGGSAAKPQRKVAVGGADSPAEADADRVATNVVSGAPATVLLVDGGVVTKDQMVLATFLEQLKPLVTAAASDELGRLGSTATCPYIAMYFARYGAQPASAAIALIKRWAPAAASASSAQAMIPLILERVRAGVHAWKETGKLPADLAAADPAASATAEATAPQAQKKSLDALEAELGPGEQVDSRLAAPLGAEAARIHRGPVAQAKAAEHHAVAFAAGNNIVMGATAPAPGTDIGDALLAHELAHTAQQRDAAADPEARKKEIGAEDKGAERDADRAAADAMKVTALGNFAGRIGDVMKTGVQLQRCGGVDPDYKPPEKVPAGPDVGRKVGASAPGKSPWFNEHVLTATETLGVADDEAQALALAKTIGRAAAVIPSNGRYFVYGISGEADVLMGVPLDLQPGYVGNAGLRIEAGVAALVNKAGAVYRSTDLAKMEITTAPSKGASADPFSAYQELNKSKGGIEGLAEPELVATFQAAMVDTALSVLATSEVDAEAKAKQFATPNATAAEEHATIDKTATDLLASQKRIDAIERDLANRRRVPSTLEPDQENKPRDLAAEAALEAERKTLVDKKRRTVTQYPMLGRYKTVDELSDFLSKGPIEREKALGGDAKTVLADVRETRKNVQDGSLNLWEVQSVVDATMAGLGIGKDSPQRAKVKAKESAQKTKETVLNIALGVFSFGFGIAGAVFTGGASLAFAAGALGLGAYDAIKSTEDHFVKNAASNTDVDPDGGLLPADAHQHWGWLVVAWAGVALDFADVLKAGKIAGEVGKVAKGTQDITQAAEALAKGDKKLLARLRAAAGDAALTDAISEGLRPGLGARVGAEITIDGTLSTEVKVFYKVDDKGRSFVTHIKVGKSAKVGDILAHAETVKMLDRYSGLTGKVRAVWDKLRSFGRKGVPLDVNPFEAGSKAFESWGELKKLDGLISYRRGLLNELLEKSPHATDAQAAIRKEIAFLENEVDIHSRVVASLSKEQGSGFVAMSTGTQDALNSGKRLPDFPDKAVLTEDELKQSAYYYEKEGDKFVLREKVGHKGGAPEPKAPAVAPPTPAKIDELKKSLGATLAHSNELTGPTLVSLEKLDPKVLAQLKNADAANLEKLGKMLAEDPTLGERLLTYKNPYGALLKSESLADLDKALLFNRLSGLKVNAARIGPALQKSGVSAADLAKLTDADLQAIGKGDRLLGEATQKYRPSTADPAKLEEAAAEFAKIGGPGRDQLRASVAHAHGLSDIPFMKNPGEALRAKFPEIPKASMDELVQRHPDALRALESASQEDVQRIISALGKASDPKEIEDILRSYMYKAQKKARKGATEGLEVPDAVGKRVEESLDNLAQARKQEHPFGFKDKAQYKQFIATVDSEVAARGIKGKAKVQGSAMHSKTPGDIDMEIVVDQAEFERLGKRFLESAPKNGVDNLKESIAKHKIPSYEFYPDTNPSLASKVKQYTLGADGKPLDVQATLIVQGSDFDVGPFL